MDVREHLWQLFLHPAARQFPFPVRSMFYAVEGITAALQLAGREGLLLILIHGIHLPEGKALQLLQDYQR